MESIPGFLRWLEIVLMAFSLTGLSINFAVVSKKARLSAGQKRTVKRFGKGAIWLHWLHTPVFIFLLTTGAILFFNLAGTSGRRVILNVHLIAAALFAAVPLIFAVVNPRRAAAFIKETFQWGRDDIAWLKSAPAYYFAASEHMPPQGRINGGQKLWQFVVVTASIVFFPTGIILWFFQNQAVNDAYFWAQLLHALAFVAVSVTFNVHLYMSMLHPLFDESLNSMLDGRVSEAYAREHYPLWFDEISKHKMPPPKAQTTEKAPEKTPANVS